MSEKIEKVFGELDNIDPKTFQILSKAISKNNLPGFDYLEYKESIRALLQMGIEESVAYKSAYATGSTVGLSIETLAKSTGHYIGVLDNEKKQFDAALQRQIETKILSREREKENLKVKIQNIDKQIATLEHERSLVQQTLENYDVKVEEAKEKLKKASDNFNQTIEKLIDQIRKDVEKIKDYLT